jgi:hypothetical protein
MAFQPEHIRQINELIGIQLKEFETRVGKTFQAKQEELDSKIKPAIDQLNKDVALVRNGLAVAETKIESVMTDLINRIGVTQATLQAEIDSSGSTFTDANAVTVGLQKQVDQMRDNIRKFAEDQIAFGKTITTVQEQTNAELLKADKNYVAFQQHVSSAVEGVRNSLSSAISSASNVAAGAAQPGGGRHQNTLDSDKRMEHLGTITGNEPIATIVEWFDKVHIKLESACPGAKNIMLWAQALDEPITLELIDTRYEDRLTAHRLNRELVSWMTSAFSLKAWSLAKKVSSSQGLEAWRLAYRGVTLQGPQQTQDEYGYLLKPTPMSKPSDIPMWIAEWEDRALKLCTANPDYQFPDNLRRQIFLECVPKETKAILDLEKNKGQLTTHAEMRKYLLAYGTQATLSMSKGPAPLSVMNLADSRSAIPEGAGDAHHSDEVWINYFQTEAGAEYANAHQEDPDVSRCLLAMTLQGKGGKFGGKSAGKGAPDTRKCWGCDETGHIFRDCPNNHNKGKGKGGKIAKGEGAKGAKGKSGKGKAGKGNLNSVDDWSSAGWAFCLQDSPPDPRLLDYISHVNEMPTSVDAPPAEQGFARPGKKRVVNGMKKFACNDGCCPAATSNSFDILVIDDVKELEITSTQIFPEVNVSAVMKQHESKKRKVPQGKSPTEKELDKMVKAIEGTKLTLRAARKPPKSHALDSIDETQPSDNYIPLHARVKEENARIREQQERDRPIIRLTGRVEEEPSPRQSPQVGDSHSVDNQKSCPLPIQSHNIDPENLNSVRHYWKIASAVTKCADDIRRQQTCDREIEEAKVRKIVESDMLFLETQIASSTLGGCCDMLPNTRSDAPQQDDFGRLISQKIFEQTGHELFVMTDQPPQLNSIGSKPLRWAKIATVLDSGACRHVTPNGVFSLAVTPSERSKEGHNYYGPAGDPIANLGRQDIKGTTDSGQLLNIGFDVAKITRPLASVSEIVRKNYRIVFDDEGSFIQDKKSGRWIDVRQEGSLYYLDLWVQIPEELINSPFVRQVA